jgi:hypothetical protein
MRQKLFLSMLLFGVLILVSNCSEEESLVLTGTDLPAVDYSYDWEQATNGDTLNLVCTQKIVYTYNGRTVTLEPKAYVKLWLEKSLVYFGQNESVNPIFSKETKTDGTSGTNPTRTIINKMFTFADGQVGRAEICYENYSLQLSSTTYQLPYVAISDLTYAKASVQSSGDDTYLADLTFNAAWQTNDKADSGTKQMMVSYNKKQSAATDQLLSTTYDKSYEWTGDKALTLFVQKNETWSVSGVKTQKYQSPTLSFDLAGKENRSLTVTSFDFTGKSSVSTSSKSDLSSDGWNIKKSTVSDVFTYPQFDASLSLDGQTFDFDLSVKFTETHQIVKTSESYAQNTTTGVAVVLGKSFSQAVVTTLSMKSTAVEPDPEPDGPAYGKIIDFAVTAVFDPSELHANGNITKKCVSVRYEKGYEWGIFEYSGSFPSSFTFTQTGYTGFNSAAMDTAKSPFEAARAVDGSNAIYWYAEDNTLLAAIDVLTCKTYGWKNIVNGKYSAFISGYTTTYSSDRYTLTVTAPDGTTYKFKSSPTK